MDNWPAIVTLGITNAIAIYIAFKAAQSAADWHFKCLNAEDKATLYKANEHQLTESFRSLSVELELIRVQMQDDPSGASKKLGKLLGIPDWHEEGPNDTHH